jgi:hypothetical protein
MICDISVSTIVKHFEKLNDPRIDRTKLHVLSDILTIAICAVICDADGWVDVEKLWCFERRYASSNLWRRL